MPPLKATAVLPRPRSTSRRRSRLAVRSGVSVAAGGVSILSMIRHPPAHLKRLVNNDGARPAIPTDCPSFPRNLGRGRGALPVMLSAQVLLLSSLPHRRLVGMRVAFRASEPVEFPAHDVSLAA